MNEPKKFYAGIGSRETPPDMLYHLEAFAMEMAARGYILRSGHAKGADRAFESGCDRVNPDLKEIFTAKDAEHPDAAWAFEEAKLHIPANRPPFDDWKPGTRNLIARNMMQVLGRRGVEPVEFTLCWTMARIREGGGTGYAMRCSVYNSIEVFNLQDGKGFSIFHEYLGRLDRGTIV